MKNYLLYTVALTVTVLLVLLLIGALPPLRIGSQALRRVDLLADVRVPQPEVTDSVALPSPPKPAFVDSCRTGMTCIEDFSDSSMRGMAAFYRALDEAGRRPVRIAYFGDSFIEADILTADLREMLQKQYGGNGVGWVDMTSATYGFRPTVRHAFQGWESHALNDTIEPFQPEKQGINSRYFVPLTDAYTELRGQKKYASRLDTCTSATVYFHNYGELQLTASVNGRRAEQSFFSSSEHLQQMTVTGHIGSVRWTVDRADSAVFFGATMDADKGIVLDNFAMRASAGMNLRYIPTQTLKDFDRMRPYDLVVLQFGLNAMTPRGVNYTHYEKGMVAAVEHLKSCFPETAFLLIGVGDRDEKDENGNLRTMPGMKNLLRYQQNMAAATGIAFWNMYEAMGGEASMAKLVESDPPMANYDYTHINFRGGNYIAGLLFEAIVYGKEQYDRREAYEAE
ncbi:MAG: hypothetical protein LBM61_02375 [Prevotellaceae bacterium]|jgi:hypothetical protein|nr:hypothetical protein [Prevotellaceae bacterium]